MSCHILREDYQTDKTNYRTISTWYMTKSYKMLYENSGICFFSLGTEQNETRI